MARSAYTSTPIVTAIVRALAILESFKPGENTLSLAEIARRTSLDKTTALRIARTLGSERYLVAMPAGAWRLGPAAGGLGTRYFRGFDQAVAIEPILRELARVTRESAVFYVREGNSRVCVERVDGPKPVRYHARLGEMLPLDKGAPGRVLLAYTGEPGEPYETIRRAGYCSTSGERDPAVAAVAVPVFGPGHVLAGVMAVTGPVERFALGTVETHIKHLRKAASRLGIELGGNRLIVRRSQ